MSKESLSYTTEETIASNLIEALLATRGCNLQLAQRVIETLPKGNPTRDVLEMLLKNNSAKLPKCG